MPTEDQDYCVTVIPGTWGLGFLNSFQNQDFNFDELVPVSWAKPDSELEKAFRKRLGDRVTFRHFGWNGRNNHGARLAASEKLKEFLEEVTDELPDHKHYLVCHSHGGNVALLALRDLEETPRKKVKGAACLATPFLVFERRPLELSAFGAFFVLLMVVAVLLGLGGGALLLGYLFIDDARVDLLFALACLVGGVLYTSLHFYLRDRIPDYLKNKQGEIYDSFSLPNLGKQLRVIRSTGDEATMALVLGQFISWLTEKLWAMISLLARLFDNLFALLGMILITGALLYAREKYGLPVPIPGPLEGLRPIPFFLFGLLVVFACLAFVQLVLGLVMVFSSALRFGLSNPLVGVLMRTTAEATPLGKVSSVLIANYDEGRKWLGLFRSHTRVYEDPKALDDLVEWVAGRDAAKEGDS